MESLTDVLVGRRIVDAVVDRDFPVVIDYGIKPEGMLVLDDGTKLYLAGNEGCGGCSSGWYELECLSTVDNIITDVKIVEDPDDDYEREGSGGRYEIFVYADNKKVNVATFSGTDGNGYYGSGFRFLVVRDEG